MNLYYHRFNRSATYICCILIVIPLCLTIYQEKRVVKIHNIKDFAKIRYNLDGKYLLVNDIDFENYKPTILTENVCDKNNIFNGHFQGNGHVITNLHYPLFHCIGSNGVVENLKLTSVNIDLSNVNNIGTLTYYNYGSVKGIYVNGMVMGNETVGGIVGSNQGYIKQVHFDGTVTGIRSIGEITGIGTTQLEITETQVTGRVEGRLLVGGIAGELIVPSENVVVYNNLIEADVVGDSFVGGVAGYTITKTNWNVITGNVIGETCVGLVSGRKNTPSSSDLFIGSISGYDQESFESIFVKDNVNIGTEIPYEYLVTYEELTNYTWLIENIGLDPKIWEIEITSSGVNLKIKSILSMNRK